MASQIAHIIYAQKYFEKYPSNEIDKDQFMLGCIFPDIRRIDHAIKRKDTHLCYDCLDLDFSGLNSFQAGWKFHLYCDMKREEILNKHGFYAIPNASDYAGQAGKLLEDQLVYAHYQNWEKLYLYLNNAPFADPRIGVTRETFGLWCAIMAKYMEKNPDNKAMRIFLSKQPTLAGKADELEKKVEALRGNKKAVAILSRIVEEIV